MNELFHRPETKNVPILMKIRVFLYERVIKQQLHFNGDIAAFLNADFGDFYSLLLSGNVVWLSENIITFKESTLWSRRLEDLHRARYSDQLGQTFQFIFDEEHFKAFCLNEPDEEDMTFFYILLRSHGLRKIRKLKIRSSSINAALKFSSGAFELFLNGNDRLKVLVLERLRITDDSCETIGRILICLDELALIQCKLDAHRFVNLLGANVCGPNSITVRDCRNQDEQDFETNLGSLIVPLINNPITEKLYFCHTHRRKKCIGYPAIKAALQSNKHLELLYICGFYDVQPDELMLLYQGIAAAPKLHTVELNIDIYSINSCVSPRQHTKMFANALMNSENNTLVYVDELSLFKYRDEEVWCREVLPILQFNYHRRLFQENSIGFPDDEQLIQALMLAEFKGNHHFRFWLVRNHTCNYLTGGVSKPGIVAAFAKEQ
jgi:hypothetical protein